MKAEILRRVDRLDRLIGRSGDYIPPGPHEFFVRRVKAAIVAVHAGGYMSGEALADAHARALGLTAAKDLKALTPAEMAQRHNAALAFVLAHRGYDRDTASPEETAALVETLIEGIPEELSARLTAG